ncbi:MAG: hypothetical protein RBU29_09945, partial [bacterium]|nr:hypothetical protein [bacterium]
MPSSNPSVTWKSLTPALSPVWKPNLLFLHAVDPGLAGQAAAEASSPALVVQPQGPGIRCRTEAVPPQWISGKTSALEEMKQMQEALQRLPANTTFVIWIGSMAGLAMRGLLEWLGKHAKRKILMIEPTLAHLRACLLLVDLRPGLECGRLHLAVAPPDSEALFAQIERFNLWGESNPQMYAVPGLALPLPARDFEKRYLRDSAQRRVEEMQQIKVIQTRLKEPQASGFSRVLLIDAWPGAPQSVHIHAIEDALRRRGAAARRVPVSGYLLDLHPQEYQRRIRRTLLQALAEFQPDLILSYAYHAPQFLAKDLAAGIPVPWVQVISNLCYYDPVYYPREHTALLERHLIPLYQERGAPHPFFVPLMADYTAPQPVPTDRRQPLVFVGNSLGLALPEVQHLLPRWQKRDALFRAIRRAESDLSHFDSQHNLYDYLAHNPLPQVESPREGYEIFRYLLCQATAARRKRLLEVVARWGLALYGNWRDSVSYNSPLREGLKGPLPIEEEPSLFAQGGIFINIHSVGHVTGPNMRFFNVPGMGGFLLSDGQF